MKQLALSVFDAAPRPVRRAPEAPLAPVRQIPVERALAPAATMLVDDLARVTVGHENPSPGGEFERTFTPQVKAEMVDALRRTYSIVQDSHDDSLGFNAQTFGHCVYHVGRRQLEEACARSGGRLAQLDEPRTLFRFQGGHYTLAFYKVGSSARENIWASFPTSESGAVTVNEEHQLTLAGLEDALVDDVRALRYVVLAHLGNPTRGLEAVYLCIPIQAEGGRIVRWGYAEPLFVAEPDASAVTLPAEPPASSGHRSNGAPGEEAAGEVVVTARRTV